MNSQREYTVEEVLEIVSTLSPKDKEIVKSELLLGEAEFERLVKEDFVKYDSTFNALA